MYVCGAMRLGGLLVWAVAACGGANGAAPPVRPAHERMEVFDAAGNASACAPPQQGCEAPAADPDFAESCRTSGFRIQRCGCAMYCTGRVEERSWDETGAQKSCPPIPADCEPPPASAAFQDACTERGHKLKACGCDSWVCTGDPTK